MSDRQPEPERSEERNEHPFSRRNVLAASGALGLGLIGRGSNTAAAQEENDAPFAAEDHDHAGDYLGESAPIDQIDVGDVVANNVATTRYADSIAEVNEYIDEAPDKQQMHEQSGVKIVLRQGQLTPSADDLPIELKSGVVIEGQGPRTTQIDVRDIGKTVFKMERGHRKDVTLNDLGVFGWGVDTPEKLGTPGSRAVYFDDVHFWRIKNCGFFGLEDGIVAPGSFSGVVMNTHVDQCNRDGIRLDQNEWGIAANDVLIIGSAIKRSGRHNVYAKDSASLYISGTDISGAAKYGVLTDRMLGVAIHGCHFEFNGGGRPLTNGLDRDGDGDLEPVAIGLSPDSSHDPTTAVSIIGNRIGYPPNTDKAGIKLGNVEGVEIASNWNGWPNRGLVELSPDIRNVSIHNNTKLFTGEFSEGLIVGPLDGSNIPPHELNDGVWKTSDFANYDELAALARDHVEKSRDNGIEVVMTDDLSAEGRAIDGADFPAGTLFRGVGGTATTVETTGTAEDAVAVALSRSEQKLADLSVRSGRGGTGVVIESDAERCEVRSVICRGDGDRDIDVNGEAAIVRGCNGHVDTSDVETVATAANLDTL